MRTSVVAGHQSRPLLHWFCFGGRPRLNATLFLPPSLSLCCLARVRPLTRTLSRACTTCLATFWSATEGLEQPFSEGVWKKEKKKKKAAIVCRPAELALSTVSLSLFPSTSTTTTKLFKTKKNKKNLQSSPPSSTASAAPTPPRPPKPSSSRAAAPRPSPPASTSTNSRNLAAAAASTTGSTTPFASSSSPGPSPPSPPSGDSPWEGASRSRWPATPGSRQRARSLASRSSSSGSSLASEARSACRGWWGCSWLVR